MMFNYSFIISIGINLAIALHFSLGAEANNNEASECLKECMKVIVKFERSFTYQFKNFEKFKFVTFWICDKLESMALCSQKCSPVDQRRFYHYTTFYRLHCVDFYEELEVQLDCLKKASPNVDKVCNERCTFKTDKIYNKESKYRNHCRTLECSLLCYYEIFSSACPEIRDTLLHLNMRHLDEIRLSTTSDGLLNKQNECRHLYDENYMKQRMLEVQI